MPVRGMLVRLTGDWQEVLRRRAASDAHPAPVRSLLGQMAAAGVLMQASIRFDGALVLQVFGDGPVKLAVAEVQPDLAFRVTGSVIGEVPADARLEAMLNVHGGGRCAITLDPKDRLPGPAALPGRGAAARRPARAAAAALAGARALHAAVRAARHAARPGRQRRGGGRPADPAHAGHRRGQPGRPAPRGRDRPRTRTSIASRCWPARSRPTNCCSLDADTVLHRLFWEETLRRFEPQQGDSAPRFACTCSRERVGRMLLGLGADEVRGIVAEQGRVEIGCEFCGLQVPLRRGRRRRAVHAAGAQAPGSAAIN